MSGKKVKLITMLVSLIFIIPLCMIIYYPCKAFDYVVEKIWRFVYD